VLCSGCRKRGDQTKRMLSRSPWMGMFRRKERTEKKRNDDGFGSSYETKATRFT
jgi:hypothetical protein